MNQSQQTSGIRKSSLFLKWYVIILLFLFGLFFTVVFILDLRYDQKPVSDYTHKDIVQDSVQSLMIPAATDTSFWTKIILLFLAGIFPLVIFTLLLFFTLRKTAVKTMNEELNPADNSVISDKKE